MVRFARVVAVDFPHHITHRGNRHADVFLNDEDRLLYLRLLAQYGQSAQLDIWGYCLMNNHIHLIVVPRHEDSLARGVGLAHRRYATTLNKRNGWSEHLWANRFFSTPLDETHQILSPRKRGRKPKTEQSPTQPESSGKREAGE